MTTNHYFNNFNQTSEQNLIESLVVECIQMHGSDMYYLPRKVDPSQTDELFGEDGVGTFDSYQIIEMYLQTVDGFEGEGDLLRKFGVAIQDTATFVVSKQRFKEIFGQTSTPNEGDLLYYPLSNSLFEIKSINSESPFFQAGKLYVYEIVVESFQYSNEVFATGIDKIDRIMTEKSYSTILNLAPGGSGVYVVGEKVVSGSASGTVRSYDGTTNELVLYKITGDFADGNIVVGLTSSATWTIQSEDGFTMTESPFADNKEIKDEGDDLLDWSETLPFGDI